MDTGLLDVVISSLSLAVGGLVLYILGAVRSDITEIRAQTFANAQAIARIEGKCKLCNSN